ncbi:MAG: hypothetical protein E2O88_11210 [Bacteroidetes bacterium]|nr:MAG: hypothetical protein E2O88_11210 [Bacteroidota bacterium]
MDFAIIRSVIDTAIKNGANVFNSLKLGWHDLIETYPLFENLRDDPEFKAIVKRAQDEKAALRAQVREMEERGFVMDLGTTTH